jgi:hypothetical protein
MQFMLAGEACRSNILSTTNCTLTNMALNPSLQGEKLVTKNLSYDKTKIAI